MNVEIRQAGAEWLVEVHGEPIGRAYSAVEALELAVYWERSPQLRGNVASEPGKTAIAEPLLLCSRLESASFLITSISLLPLNHQHNCERVRQRR